MFVKPSVCPPRIEIKNNECNNKNISFSSIIFKKKKLLLGHISKIGSRRKQKPIEQ